MVRGFRVAEGRERDMSTPAPPTPAQLISVKLDAYFAEKNGVVPPIIFKESLMHVIQGVESVRAPEADDGAVPTVCAERSRKVLSPPV